MSYHGFGDESLTSFLRDPQAVSKAAQSYAAQIPKVADQALNTVKEKTYAYMYTQTYALLDRVSKDPTIQKWVGQANNVYYDVLRTQNFVEQLQTKGKLDASGVADGVQLAASYTRTIVGFADAFGGLSPQTKKDISDYVGIATGCVTGITAGAATPFGLGAVAAAIGCALAFIVKAISGKPDWQPVELACGEERALYWAAAPQQVVMQTDAARLAAVLYHHYGYRSFDELVSRLDTAKCWNGNAEEATVQMPRYADGRMIESWISAGRYPAAPKMEGDKGLNFEYLQNHRVPAVSGKSLLQMLSDSRIPDAEMDWVLTDSLTSVAWINSMQTGERESGDISVLPGSPYPSWLGSGQSELLKACDLATRYVIYEDVNVAAISLGAAIGRGMIQQTGRSLVTAKNNSAAKAGLYPMFNTPDYYYFDFAPFVRVEELLHYFMAITIRERQTVQSASMKPWDAYGIEGVPLPVRFVGARGKSGDATSDPASPGYHPNCWTGLYHGGDFSCQSSYSTSGSTLYALVSRGDLNDPLTYSAIKEFAWLRLVSAFTQMLNGWRWRLSSDRIIDPIADIAANEVANPIPNEIRELRQPIDPRQIVPVNTARIRYKNQVGEWRNDYESRTHWAFNETLSLNEDIGSTIFGLSVPFRDIRNCGHRAVEVQYPLYLLGTPMEASTGPLWHLKAEPVRNGRRLAGAIEYREGQIGKVIAEAQARAIIDHNLALKILHSGVDITWAGAPATQVIKVWQESQQNKWLLPVIGIGGALVLMKLLKKK